MPTIIMHPGLPGSGKSTHARQVIDADPDKTLRVNKDDLRAMLFNSHWSKEREKKILALRDHIIVQALKAGKDVIVDDTNSKLFHLERLREIASQHGAQILVRFFKTPLAECLRRDAGRIGTARVGETVIQRMWESDFREMYEDAWALISFCRSVPVEVILPKLEIGFSAAG